MWNSFTNQIKNSSILLLPQDILNLALTCNQLSTLLDPIKPRVIWNKHLILTHSILIKAQSMLRCVKKGDFLLSYCAKPTCWCDTGLKIALEELITSEKALYWYNYSTHEKPSVCSHQYESANGELSILTDPSNLSQHSVTFWCTSTFQNEKVIPNKSWLTYEGYLTSSTDPDYCECLHCTTFGCAPNEFCECSRCSDPVSGKNYYTKSNYSSN